MGKIIYEQIFNRVKILTDGFNVKPNRMKEISVKGYMDLVVENLGDNRYSLTHYYKQNGDLCPDPDMEIRVNHDLKMAEAMTLQDPLTGFRRVYYDDDKIDLKAKKELNSFLLQWLKNLQKQGFYNI